MATNNLGRRLAKVAGIDPDYRSRVEPAEAVQSAANASLQSSSADAYYETEPTVAEYLSSHTPTWDGVWRYLRSLFPFLDWIFHYNLIWLTGDIIAGVTVGFVVIPQGMAYAILAGLPAEYGLYTSFVGFILYFAFATSKDITIGTVAVMSTLVGRIVTRVMAAHPELEAPDIARALSVITGAVLLFIGLSRLGWIVEFIPLVAITSFMTGAAVNIAAGQVPKLMGISNVNTREATYLIIINTLKGLPRTKIDAAMGLTALFMLYLIRWFCNLMATRQPNRKLWFFLGTLRLAFVILLYTLISWLSNRGLTDAKKAKFEILGTVPSGFRIHGAPTINMSLLEAIAPDLPTTIIVAIIEHIAISKSFGRVNNYRIDPSQELLAIGFTNVFGPFLGAYPATGSFSRTAIKSKAGVRTPLAGIWTAVMVILALYALTKVFFYIPMSSLSGLIIHAVGDLITPPDVVYRFWQISPLEVVLFFAGVIIMVFTDIETGIYFSVCASAALLLVRIAKARGTFVGGVDIYRAGGGSTGSKEYADTDGSSSSTALVRRPAFLPLDYSDGSNPAVDVRSPYPGVIIYRFTEGLNYTNVGHYMDDLVAYIQQNTRRTTLDSFEKIGDRPWNDPGPRRGAAIDRSDARPTLRAVILDLSSVNNVDVTSVQGLIDTRTQLDHHTAPDAAEWHFACAHNRWTRRALASAGFGFPSERNLAEMSGGSGWRPIFSVAPEKGDAGASGAVATKEEERIGVKDVEAGLDDADRISSSSGTEGVSPRARDGGASARLVAVRGVSRPFFHVDVAAAVENVVANLEGRAGREKA